MKFKRNITFCVVMLILSFCQTHSQSVCTPYKSTPPATSLECTASKCTATCAAKYTFPKGETMLEIECQGKSWKITTNQNYKDSKELPTCQPTCSPTCLNKGKCIGPNKCQCTADFFGPNCKEKACKKQPEITKNAKTTCRATQCAVSCLPGYKYKSLATTKNLQCKNGNWVSVSKNLALDSHCLPFCYSKCENGGVCIEPNKCLCLPDFRGAQCQHSTEKCSIKKTGFNGSSNCISTEDELNCSIACPDGMEFEFTPTSNYKCKYSEGKFSPSNIPKCRTNVNTRMSTNNRNSPTFPEIGFQCNPRCQNDGKCVYTNTCQCTKKFAGPQCEFPVERCSLKKTGFNGGYSCSGNRDELACSLSCPPGVEYEFAPASAYKCKYSTGQFIPSNVPKCVYDDNVQIIGRVASADMDDDRAFTCNPRCQNGGECVFTNLCQCPRMFRGPQCQHPVANCEFKKTGFNGSYNCTGATKDMTCTISCPVGVELDGPPANQYVCQYDSGRFFPSPVPRCIYGDDVEVIRRSRTGY